MANSQPFTMFRAVGPQVPAEVKANPRKFARVVDGKVAEIISEVQNIAEEWNPDIRKTFVEVTDIDEPKVGDLHKGAKRFEAAPIPEQTPIMKRNVAFREGVKLGKDRFSMSEADWKALSDAAQHVSMFQEFPDGKSTFEIQSAKFNSTSDFLNAFKKLSNWRNAWNQHVEGKGNAPNDEV